MRVASFGIGAFARGPRWSRSKTKEMKMRTYSLTELMNLTRAELFALHRQIADAIAQLPDGSPERSAALASLRNIRRIIVRCEFAPT
jgi:hypothetical protein